ncbi:MAG TPA: hypothetical protein VGK73_25920, partial [Polyangiaceae bacterium]
MPAPLACESPRGAFRTPRPLWTLRACVLVCSGCSFSAGAVDAYDFPITKRAGAVRSNHVGVQGASYLHLPRDYGWVIGMQSAVLGQTGPKTLRDQWRIAGAFGYTSFPTFYGPPVGFELIGHLGMLRGDVGKIQAPVGWYYGVRAGFPLRLDSSSAAWERDGELAARFFLVPEIGVSPVHAIQSPG